MSRIIKEEGLIIDKMFSWCTSAEEILIIKKTITEVKNRKGLYSEVIKYKGDLYHLKFSVADATGLNLKASGELGRELWRLTSAPIQRERLIKKAGISFGIWMYTADVCQYPSHSKLNGKKFSIKNGAKVGFFKRIHIGELVGCGCFSKPVLPF
ncbi:Uncharacterised protein [Yersinia enterocolitica]|uniref:hypothetical protein n=1 Tax=Yersinia enterocolitica TaxID=630 RepID=UPI00065A8B37|nr:hypothetical protein [Yersinia enterocolitica]CRY06290.1 Uncharacterised protein [Yersinia enterocolitica]